MDFHDPEASLRSDYGDSSILGCRGFDARTRPLPSIEESRIVKGFEIDLGSSVTSRISGKDRDDDPTTPSSVKPEVERHPIGANIYFPERFPQRHRPVEGNLPPTRQPQGRSEVFLQAPRSIADQEDHGILVPFVQDGIRHVQNV